MHPQPKGLDQNNKPEGHQVGRSSERGLITITSKNKNQFQGNKNKTKTTPKGKASLNYREINNKKVHQVNDSNRKEEPIMHSLETEIGRRRWKLIVVGEWKKAQAEDGGWRSTRKRSEAQSNGGRSLSETPRSSLTKCI